MLFNKVINWKACVEMPSNLKERLLERSGSNLGKKVDGQSKVRSAGTRDRGARKKKRSTTPHGSSTTTEDETMGKSTFLHC